jgi:hypothetical protein
MERPTKNAIRAVTVPVTGFAALVRLGLGRLVSPFDPQPDVETRVDLSTPDQQEPPTTE